MAAIAVLTTWLLLSFAALVYAEKKGRSGVGFLLLSLFLSPLVAFVLIAVGPSNPQRMGLRKCPQCAEWIKHEALKCRFCGLDLIAGNAAQQPLAASAPAVAAQPEPSLKWVAFAGVFFVVAIGAAWSLSLATEDSRSHVRRSAPRAMGAPDAERAAIASLRTISTSCFTYDARFPRGYPKSLSVLGPPPDGIKPGVAAADLIDLTLSSGTKDGYVFEYSPGRLLHGRVNSYTAVARPLNQDEGRRFFLDESGVIRQGSVLDPDKYSPPI